MNQILNVNSKKSKRLKFFKIQFYLSLILVVFFIIYMLFQMSNKEKENSITNVTGLNAKLNSIFSSNIESKYLGRIKIEKIDLDYFVFNLYSEDLLKILPCKFSGGNLR
jgi:hypothetical protein